MCPSEMAIPINVDGIDLVVENDVMPCFMGGLGKHVDQYGENEQQNETCGMKN